MSAAELAFEAWWAAKTYRENILRLVYRTAFMAGYGAGEKHAKSHNEQNR